MVLGQARRQGRLGPPQPDHRRGGVRGVVLRGELLPGRPEGRPGANPRALEGAVLSLRGGFYRASTRLRELRDRVLYPETADPADHWLRVVRNGAVNERIASLDPPARTAVAIQGRIHA